MPLKSGWLDEALRLSSESQPQISQPRISATCRETTWIIVGLNLLSLMLPMSLAPWRSLLARALHQNRSLIYSRYLQLATLDREGRPANRTVVFRGFLDATDQLKFVTDTRSAKIDQIVYQPWGEACWYFPKTREQFRLAGQLTSITADHCDPQLIKARQLMWQNLSDTAREQFTWPSPGTSLPESSPANPTEGAKDEPPDAHAPLPNFCLLLLDPERVDHLELRGKPQNRCLYLRCDPAEVSENSVPWLIKPIRP